MLGKCLLLSLVILSSKSAVADPTTNPPSSIEKMFSDELDTVRGISKESNTEREHKALINSLIERLQVGDANQRYEASVLLERAVKKDDIQLIVEALNNGTNSQDAVTSLVTALGSTREPSTLNILRDKFNGGDERTQIAVIDALAKIPDEKVVNMLGDILKSGDNAKVHIRAASGLGRIGGDRALYTLHSVLDRFKSGAGRSAILWAIKYAKGELPEKRVDSDFNEGRQQNYYYKGMIYYLYRPAFRVDDSKTSWLLTCIHGSSLNFEQVIDLCQPIAKAFKTSLFVPFFDPINFPDYREFSLDGIRADKRFFEILDLLKEKAEIRTKEIYLIGLEDGGDFAQRLTLFYPDRIARAAFTSTYFYPLDSKDYFPRGLRTTPLAPDLKFDILKFIKTDAAFILDPYQGGQRAYTTFRTGLEDYTKKSQHVMRIRTKELTEKENFIEGITKSAREFLFPATVNY